jgi:3-methyl-2-oxobutanoate hydroxymethyltransferase
MGHIGWTPQARHALGGKVRVQGKTREQARALLADALAVQESGAFAVVLELVPEQLAAAITARLDIPTIGIGAGAGCSGQVLVINDLLGLGEFTPRHARRYAEIGAVIRDAATRWVNDVESGAFPSAAETVRMEDAVLEEALGRSPLDQPSAAEATPIPLDRDL